MKRYKLLKDTVNCKAGTIFESKSEGLYGNNGYGEISFAHGTINNFDEWFEEIKETDWKPKIGDTYWLIATDGMILRSKCDNFNIDNTRYEIGNYYRTKEDCEHAKKVQIARTKIRRSSNFKPDWNDVDQIKWHVVYDHVNCCLDIRVSYMVSEGAIVYYETREDTRQAIKDLEPDYLLHFGVEEGN